jgi:hypothetical protein
MEQSNGHVVWGRWALDYAVLGKEGLSLLNGFFAGRRIFWKLSLPVIRVKYTQDEDFWHNPLLKNGCGPYNDQITWDPVDFGEDLNFISGPHHLVRISNCDDNYVCVRPTTLDNKDWLELGVYARIGAYHIYQSWYLNNDGIILPRVFSKGLSCNLNHWHHPYWRFDFDLDGDSNQRVNVFDGSQFRGIVTLEGKLSNASFGDCRCNVQNLSTGLKAWIIPPALDEEHGVVGPTEFSNLDFNVRKYRPEEDRNWPHPTNQDISFAVHENPDGGDIVFWQVCHLFHQASEGKDHWHEVGPTIVVELPDPLPVREDQCRSIFISGRIDIKDFRLVGHDRWGHHDFSAHMKVNPNAPHAEAYVQRGPNGDCTADLIIRVDLAPDNSIAVNFTASLYDGVERVASSSNHFNVLRDSSLGWQGLHLVDHHRGDPDTADFSFTVVNAQCAGDDWSGIDNNWRSLGGFFPVGCEVSAVARMPNQLDLFTTGNDGRVYTSWWHEGLDWSGINDNWASIGGFFPSGNPVGAVARLPDHLDLFIVGNDGRVYTSWWREGSPWSGVNDNWRSIGGIFPPRARVAALARKRDQLDLFIVGNDGRVYTSWWHEGADWTGVNDNWLSLGGFFPPGSPVTAVARMPNHLDLFVVGNDGRVYTSWWQEGSPWSGINNNWRSIGGYFPVRAQVTPVARTPDHIDLFVTGNDGRVYTSWWHEGADWSGVNDNWRSIGGFFPVGAPLAALARMPNQLDVFVTGNDGRVYTSWWHEGADWTGVADNWRAIGGIFPAGAPLAATARTPHNLDVFVCGNDGRVYTSWWSEQ